MSQVRKMALMRALLNLQTVNSSSQNPTWRSSRRQLRSSSCSRVSSSPRSSSTSAFFADGGGGARLSGVDKAGRVALAALAAGAAGATLFFLGTVKDRETGRRTLSPAVLSRPESASASTSSEPREKRQLTSRERRFIKFASVEFDGQIYMTPQDFLESVVEGEPRPRMKRKNLTEREVEDMMRRLPKLHKNNDHFFRSLGNAGIISYSEYLFLLTILIKPQSGFKIAFAMLDQDGNGWIDKEEFRVLETVFSSAAKERKANKAGGNNSNNNKDEKESDSSETKEVSAEGDPKSKVMVLTSGSAAVFDDVDHGLHRAHKVDTSLLIYFFGKRGLNQLRFDDFHRFMDNLQTEVLEMEFQEFSKGARTIGELDFARILLRYTFLNSEEYDRILDRLVRRLHESYGCSEIGIDFTEFKDFCLFLNNLDDFQIAMRMYTLADKPISEEEFRRAVSICTGRSLSGHLVHTVFQIFDNDGDGLLSYQEFVTMMKDRVNRGLKTFSRQEGWKGFKRCVKQEIKAAGSAAGGGTGGSAT